MRDFAHSAFPRQTRQTIDGTFHQAIAYLDQDAEMKSLLTSRSEIRWLVLAVPSVLAAHWILTAAGARLMNLVPASLRAVLHLL